MSGERPRPFVSRDTAFFWDAALERRLDIQKCSDCGTLQHPPSPACETCHSFELSAETVSGEGVVESYTIHHHPPVPGFDTPPVIALVRLLEGPLLLSNIVGPDAAAVAIDDRVSVAFLEVAPDYVIPQFVRSGARPGAA